MIYKGLHLSIGDGIDAILKQIDELQINCFQLFLESPLSWTPMKGIYRFQTLIEKARTSFGVNTVFVHSPYLVHLSSGNSSTRVKSWKKVKEDLIIATELGIDGYVVHLDMAQENDLITFKEEYSYHLGVTTASTPLLFENMASAKLIGSNPFFVQKCVDEISNIYPALVCLDTAHLAAAGYDIDHILENPTFQDVLDETTLVHLNDLKTATGSSRDVHENIGAGSIGFGTLKRFVRSLKDGTSVVLETPQDKVDNNRKNIEALDRMIKE
ncbi:TIM barrel protein [Coprothermobacter platensis]|uniref:TIM barrel protein n=1 Tax=Coprothermobacter platensis TaxID=108819 RepID=UPI00037FF02E|nr:TIM barrel protein [Coprothermobacter platensis]